MTLIEKPDIVQRRVVVASPVGLHARPAAQFCKAAAAQPVAVTVAAEDADGPGEPVDARSVLAVMGLGVRGGQAVLLRASGDGAAAAVDELAALLETDHNA